MFNPEIRHTCEQGEIGRYTWTAHDGRTFGSQTLEDPANNVKLKTEMLKVPGGQHGGDWVVRISGESLTAEEESHVMIYYYIGVDGQGYTDLKNDVADGEGLKGHVIVKGSSPDVGEFKVTVVDSFEKTPNTPPPGGVPGLNLPNVGRTQYAGFQMAKDELWKIKNPLSEFLMRSAQANVQIMQKASVQPNPAQAFMFRSEVQEDANIDVIYNSESSGNYDSLSEFTGSTLSTKIEEATVTFENRFEAAFGLRKKGYKSKEVKFAEAVMSNLIGGIGYFHGHNIIDRALQERARREIVDSIQDLVEEEEDDYFGGEDGGGDGEGSEKVTPNPQVEGPWTLFSAVPSRPFFPRGFMWDEGFHQLLIGKWDNDLSLDVIRHWAHLIDENGWAAREQILGDEAHSKVPKEFQVQFSHLANPPTLLMPLIAFIDRLQSPHPVHKVDAEYTFTTTDALAQSLANLPNDILNDKVKSVLYLKDVYDRFGRQREWFRDTQWGDVGEWVREVPGVGEVYRWRGRTERHTLTSGLDDYPRSFPPHVGELHVDLTSWMGFMSKSLGRIAKELGEDQDVGKYEEEVEAVVANLKALHWDEKNKLFSDLTIGADGLPQHVTHPGYLSLFPYILGLIPPTDAPLMTHFLNLIRDPDQLWTPYGLRSLSKQDSFFGADENYWRGPIWINLNYLVLGTLRGVMEGVGVDEEVRRRAAEVYVELRGNLVRNIFKVYEETGFVWEQYSPETGEGKRSHPFTGWTSLVVLIMAEQYPRLF
ncbi:Processing alpha glucosidase I [Dinochytrium kinnereticum]|nr:Processing alpha glucosidase I [Dinochytrium kinnereticum]